ncbi:MAG: hypothetical protein ACT4OL_07875, partial [Nitrospiraceae bacterium]
QRAFISNFHPQIGAKQITDGKTTAVQFGIVWDNKGITPARTTLTRSNFQRFDQGLPKDFSFPDLTDSRPVVASLPPGGKHQDLLDVDIEHLRAVFQKKGIIAFWGWFAYYDVFEDTPLRLSEFCFELIDLVVNGKDITDPEARLRSTTTNCQRHNCTDEDCPDYAQRRAKYLELRSPNSPSAFFCFLWVSSLTQSPMTWPG